MLPLYKHVETHFISPEFSRSSLAPRDGAVAHRDVPRVDQGCAAGTPAPLVGQGAGETSPQTDPGGSNLRCTCFHTTLCSVLLEGRVSQQVFRAACERAPSPSEWSPAHTHTLVLSCGSWCPPRTQLWHRTPQAPSHSPPRAGLARCRMWRLHSCFGSGAVPSSL